MKQQFKYRLTYGSHPTHDELIIWAFDVKQAIEFGEWMKHGEAKKQRLTCVEQMPLDLEADVEKDKKAYYKGDNSRNVK